jgi:hypothetical protein
VPRLYTVAPPAGVRSSTPCCLGGCWPSKQKKGCEKAEAAASTHGTTTKPHQARRHQAQCPSLVLGAVALLWHNSEERRAALAPSALLVLTLMVVAFGLSPCEPSCRRLVQARLQWYGEARRGRQQQLAARVGDRRRRRHLRLWRLRHLRERGVDGVSGRGAPVASRLLAPRGTLTPPAPLARHPPVCTRLVQQLK